MKYLIVLLLLVCSCAHAQMIKLAELAGLPKEGDKLATANLSYKKNGIEMTTAYDILFKKKSNLNAAIKANLTNSTTASLSYKQVNGKRTYDYLIEQSVKSKLVTGKIQYKDDLQMQLTSSPAKGVKIDFNFSNDKSQFDVLINPTKKLTIKSHIDGKTEFDIVALPLEWATVQYLSKTDTTKITMKPSDKLNIYCENIKDDFFMTFTAMPTNKSVITGNYKDTGEHNIKVHSTDFKNTVVDGVITDKTADATVAITTKMATITADTKNELLTLLFIPIVDCKLKLEYKNGKETYDFVAKNIGMTVSDKTIFWLLPTKDLRITGSYDSKLTRFGIMYKTLTINGELSGEIWIYSYSFTYKLKDKIKFSISKDKVETKAFLEVKL